MTLTTADTDQRRAELECEFVVMSNADRTGYIPGYVVKRWIRVPQYGFTDHRCVRYAGPFETHAQAEKARQRAISFRLSKRA